MNYESIISDQQRRIVVLKRRIEVETEFNARLKSRPQFEATAIRQGEIIAELQVKIQGLLKRIDVETESNFRLIMARNIALNERDSARHVIAKQHEQLNHYRSGRTTSLQALARERKGNYRLRVAAQRLVDYLYPQGEWRGWSNINGEILPLASDLFRALKSESQCEPEPVNPRLTMMLEEDKRLAAEVIHDAVPRDLQNWLREPVKVTGENFRRNVDMQRAGS